jgi:hypothetical protein
VSPERTLVAQHQHLLIRRHRQTSLGPTQSPCGTAENGCVLGEWTEGAEAVGIPLTMRQDEELVSGTVEGITGGILTLIHGSNIYQGTIDGNQADMVIYGQRAESSGNCSYSLNNRVNAKFDGDFVQGTLRFVKEGNDNPDCAEVECSSLIDFTGSRPPSR